jgi:HEAT repeat protein
MHETIEQLCGRADGGKLSAKKLTKLYDQALDYLIPLISQDDVGARYKPQILLQDMASHASRPDAESDRAALAKVLVKRLEEDTPLPARVWIVRQLERMGAAESVSTLAKLLGSDDAELRDVARRALEKNPADTASNALRKALKDAEGNAWRIGLINALGERKDEAAVDMLTDILSTDEDIVVATAAAHSLGSIGDDNAVKSLINARAAKSGLLQKAITDAMMDRAVHALDQGDQVLARRIYGSLYEPNEATSTRATALRGLALVGGDMTTLLTEAITADAPELQQAAVQAARALHDAKVNSTLAAMLPRLSSTTQEQLLQLLTDQPDLAYLDHVLPLVNNDNETVQIYALKALSAMGNEKSVDALVAIANQSQGILKDTATESLARISGEGVEAHIAKIADSGDEKTRAIAISSFADRYTLEAVPALLRYAAEDSNNIRRTAFKSLAKVTSDDDVPALVDLMMNGHPKSRKDAAAALKAMSGNIQDREKQGEYLLTVMDTADVAGKALLLDIFGGLGGDKLLQIVLNLCASEDEILRDAAIRSLCDWQDYAAAEELLKFAASENTEMTHHVLALRGWARLERDVPNMPMERRLAHSQQAMDIARRAEEKKTALAVISTFNNKEGGNMLVPYLEDSELVEEAGAAILNLVGNSLIWWDFKTSLELVSQVEQKNISDGLNSQARRMRKRCEDKLGITSDDVTKPGFHASDRRGRDRIKVLLLTGQMNQWHDWKGTTKIMKASLEESGHFAVDVMTAPPKKSDLSGWKVDFAKYPVILMNMDGDMWPEPLRKSFEDYVDNGGGLVSVHSTDNAFTRWPAFNKMIGVGGWGGRNETAGSYVRWRDGKMVIEDIPGRCGSHGPRHEFIVTFREVDPVISKGLPKEWKHGQDELYDSLRGPAENLSIVATAFSAKDKGGTEENEPMLMTIRYGKGRVFHTTLGHDVAAMTCAGFPTTLQRGVEWAATGDVTQPVPDDFPTADQVSIRN